MNVGKAKTAFMFVMVGIIVSLGLYMVYEGLMHMIEGEAQTHAELAIAHIGHITGNQHLIIVGIGCVLIFAGAKFTWKIDIRQTLRRPKSTLDRITHSASDLTKEIARRIKLNRHKQKE